MPRSTRESAGSLRNVRFFNRPFGVKHFQTIHCSSVDVAQGSRFSSESAPRPLYGAFVVKELARQQIFRPSSVFVFDLKDRFFRPTRTSPWSPRGQGWPLHQPCGMLRLYQAIP